MQRINNSRDIYNRRKYFNRSLRSLRAILLDNCERLGNKKLPLESKIILINHGFQLANKVFDRLSLSNPLLTDSFTSSFLAFLIIHGFRRKNNVEALLEFINNKNKLPGLDLDKAFNMHKLYMELSIFDENNTLEKKDSTFYDYILSTFAKGSEDLIYPILVARTFDLTISETYNENLRARFDRPVSDNFFKNLISFYYPLADYLNISEKDILINKGTERLYPKIFSKVKDFRDSNLKTFKKIRKYFDNILRGAIYDRLNNLNGFDSELVNKIFNEIVILNRIKSVGSITMKIIKKDLLKDQNYIERDLINDWIGFKVIFKNILFDDPNYHLVAHDFRSLAILFTYHINGFSSRVSLKEVEHKEGNYNADHVVYNFLYNKLPYPIEVQFVDHKNDISNLESKDTARAVYKSKIGNIFYISKENISNIRDQITPLLNNTSYISYDIVFDALRFIFTNEEDKDEIFNLKFNFNEPIIVGDLLLATNKLSYLNVLENGKQLDLGEVIYDKKKGINRLPNLTFKRKKNPLKKSGIDAKTRFILKNTKQKEFFNL